MDKDRLAEILEEFAVLNAALKQLQEDGVGSREFALALTKVEEGSMWFGSGVLHGIGDEEAVKLALRVASKYAQASTD